MVSLIYDSIFLFGHFNSSSFFALLDSVTCMYSYAIDISLGALAAV